MKVSHISMMMLCNMVFGGILGQSIVDRMLTFNFKLRLIRYHFIREIRILDDKVG